MNVKQGAQVLHGNFFKCCLFLEYCEYVCEFAFDYQSAHAPLFGSLLPSKGLCQTNTRIDKNNHLKFPL